MSFRKTVLCGVLALSLAASTAQASPAGGTYGSSSNDGLMYFALAVSLALAITWAFHVQTQPDPFMSSRGAGLSTNGKLGDPGLTHRFNQRDEGRILMRF